MNRLSKEKRSQLVLVLVMIALVVTGLYMGLIRHQQQTLENLAVEKQKAIRKNDQIIEKSKNSQQIDAELAALRKELNRQEEDMASDDFYAASIDLIRNFQAGYPIDIKQFMSKGASDNTVFAKFPYRQFTISILGSGRYHEIGKFIADFENRFHTARVLNLELTPGGGATPEEAEQLVFRMDIVFLIKQTSATSAKKP